MSIDKNYFSLKENISSICAEAGRNPDEITIVAVSKTFPIQSILELRKLNQLDFGENRVRELRDKYYNISFHNKSRFNWHFVGHLQSNKVKDIIAYIHLIHSVDNFKLAEEIDSNSKRINKTTDVLVQVNTSGESQKSGVAPKDALNLCRQISFLENVRLKGLMTIARFTDDENILRDNFRTLKNLYDEMKVDFSDFEFLSMGMTNDYKIAIEEGSNMLRIGSAIFGERE